MLLLQKQDCLLLFCANITIIFSAPPLPVRTVGFTGYDLTISNWIFLAVLFLLCCENDLHHLHDSRYFMILLGFLFHPGKEGELAGDTLIIEDYNWQLISTTWVYL